MKASGIFIEPQLERAFRGHVVRSIWMTGGFLSAFNGPESFRGIGVIDFAGSGVVHMTGGAT